MGMKLQNEHIDFTQKKITHSMTIQPRTLSDKEKEALIDSLYQLHSRIFDGVTKERFSSTVVNSTADWTRIRIYKNSANEWVGYCAAHRFYKSAFSRSLVVLRAEAGILREYRGRSQTLWFAFYEAIKYRITHPFCELYYLGTFVHPSVLYMFSRYFSKCYPNGNMPIPASVKELMLELAHSFDIEPVEKQNILVRKVNWITNESTEDRYFWQNHTHPAVKFYIKTNPGYIKGNGLLVLLPLNFKNIFMSLAKFVRNKLVRHLLTRTPHEHNRHN